MSDETVLSDAYRDGYQVGFRAGYEAGMQDSYDRFVTESVTWEETVQEA